MFNVRCFKYFAPIGCKKNWDFLVPLAYKTGHRTKIKKKTHSNTGHTCPAKN